MPLLVEGLEKHPADTNPRGVLGKALQHLARSEKEYHGHLAYNVWAGVTHAAISTPGTQGIMVLKTEPWHFVIKHQTTSQEKEWRYPLPETPHEESDIVNTTVELVKALLS